MNSTIDPTKLPGYNPAWEYHASAPDLIPCRHVCGEIVYAQLESDYPQFYNRSDSKGSGIPILSCPKCDSPLNMDWMRTLYLVEPMPYHTAIHTCGKVCSNCWSAQLTMSEPIHIHNETEDMVIDYRIVTCRDCGVETRGYVTQRYVGRTREKDYLDYGRALTGLAEALELEQAGLPIQLKSKEKLSVNQNLAMLGF